MRDRRLAIADGRVLVALDVHELLEHVLHLDQVLGVLHHLVDVLVGARDLVEQHLGVAVLDALHRAARGRPC